MMPRTTLSLTAAAHAQLHTHLFPGDGKEAAAVLVCSRVPGSRMRMLVREVITVPHDACLRRTDCSLTWPGSYIEQAIDAAEAESLGIVLIHSHPNGFPAFSYTDDQSDHEVMPSIFAAFDAWHGSAVMIPTGAIFGRIYNRHGVHTPIDLISVAGDDLHFWWRDDLTSGIKRPMAFTPDMTCEVSRLTAAVIGISGTGSPTAEQLCRLGFGRVIGIDFDHVEHKNLNRILNTTFADAEAGRLKVEAFAEHANCYRAKPYFEGMAINMMSREGVMALAQADVIFSCVDTHRARMIADRAAAAFLLPLIDVGVGIPTRNTTRGLAIAEVTGRVDYVYPGGSSLRDRGVYTPESLQAEALAEEDPIAYAERVKVGYIEGLPNQAPAVIALNMRAASAGVLEFIARAYPYRHEPNANYARSKFMLAEAFEEFTSESEFNHKHALPLATGSAEPLLGLPILGQEEI
ncbi:hypothetical protein ABIE32_000233 [Comamonas sp. 4034]